MRYDNAWDFPSRRVYKDREGVRAAEIRLEELMEQYSGMLEYIARGILRECGRRISKSPLTATFG